MENRTRTHNCHNRGGLIFGGRCRCFSGGRRSPVAVVRGGALRRGPCFGATLRGEWRTRCEESAAVVELPAPARREVEDAVGTGGGGEGGGENPSVWDLRNRTLEAYTFFNLRLC